MHRLVLCAALVTSLLAAPRRAAADATDSYSTVDSVEVNKRNATIGSNPTITVRGIREGNSAPSTQTYVIPNNGNFAEGVETALSCQRLAVVVMSKPGKFLFAVGTTGCRISLVAP